MCQSTYKYHGIFSEINRLKAAICIQKKWRLCRYNPKYNMCEMVTTHNIENIKCDFNVTIEDTEYIKNRLKQKQNNFKLELKNTQRFLQKYYTLKNIYKSRVILKPSQYR